MRGVLQRPDDGTEFETQSRGESSVVAPPKINELAPLFSQLEILELIGHGGMGAVYRARQLGLNRLVALKVLPQDTGMDTRFTDRFTREARASLSHPNIVALHDFGQADGLFYFVMEFVDGTNLPALSEN